MNVESATIFIAGDKITIQSAAYIEHGCYFEIKGAKVSLFEIPYGGGGKKY